jgi:hypothetical protein
MRLSFLDQAAALASILTLACTDQPVTAPPSASQPSLRAQVSRPTLDFAWVVIDEKRGLTAVLGATAEENAAACQTGLFPEQIAYLWVDRPDSSVKLLGKSREMGVTVWPGASGDICGELLSVTPLVTGRARVMYVDNDPFLSFNRNNAYSVRAHGVLTSPSSSEELRLLVRFHALWFPQAESPEVQVSEIRLNPTSE